LSEVCVRRTICKCKLLLFTYSTL